MWFTGRESALQLAWRKCRNDSWCRFESAVLPDPPASGILLIWSAEPRRVWYIGQGAIAQNLKWGRQFEPIARHRDLLVTWATVPEDRQSGIRNYLCARLSPVHCDRPTADPPIAVNVPWE